MFDPPFSDALLTVTGITAQLLFGSDELADATDFVLTGENRSTSVSDQFYGLVATVVPFE